MNQIVNNQFFVKFWGVRGSIPTPGNATIRYGGNTSCLEIGVGEKTLIFDAGTGLRNLGKNLTPQPPLELYMICSSPIITGITFTESHFLSHFFTQII
jgi:phosphoribosyl 1,2-cyclic phosphodiesterase